MVDNGNKMERTLLRKRNLTVGLILIVAATTFLWIAHSGMELDRLWPRHRLTSFIFSSSSSSSLPSVLLDAPRTPHEEQQRGRLLQSLYCKHFFPVPNANSSGSSMRFVGISLPPVNAHSPRRAHAVSGMYVIGDGTDVVSRDIARDGSWEIGATSLFLQAMQVADDIGYPDPLFLDVGSNIGWHSVAVLAYGFRVLSIDAMTSNMHHFLSTLCMAPKLLEKSIFINHGLGEKTGTCAISSPDTNSGDGSVTCDPAAIAIYKEDPNPPRMQPLRQFLPIAPLDRFVNEDVWLFKMDVEGFELDVLKGATRLFSRRRVFFLVAEAWWYPASIPKSREMIFTVVNKLGFTCSLSGWVGRRMPAWEKPEDIEIGEGIHNIWCIHRQHMLDLGQASLIEQAETSNS